jgi:hypothetical protein
MEIDVNLRAHAARTFLDAVSVADLESSNNEEVALLALAPLGLSLGDDARLDAALAAAFDLLWFLVRQQSQMSGVDSRELISNLRRYVLPAVYPDATG